jgi:hypothetical protein
MKPRSQPKPDQRAPRLLGSIRADEAMPSAEFRRRFGISDKAWRAMLRRGLKAAECGKIKVVIGSDALDFFRRLADGEGQ